MFYSALRYGSYVELSESENLRNRLAKAVTCYISEVREVSGYGSCGTKCGKAHQSTIWGIDESINGTGLPKRACKKNAGALSALAFHIDSR